MTKADFTEIADAMAEARRRIEYLDLQPRQKAVALNALQTAVTELSTACARQYKGGYGFNRSKFVEACGFPEA